jgi:hypothetical protein
VNDENWLTAIGVLWERMPPDARAQLQVDHAEIVTLAEIAHDTLFAPPHPCRDCDHAPHLHSSIVEHCLVDGCDCPGWR